MYKTKGGFQLTLQILSLVVGFTVWSITVLLMPFTKQDVSVTEGQTSIILVIPAILGSALRVPSGYLTNIIGAKWVFFISFIVLLFPIPSLSQAQTPGMLIALGLFLGVGGVILSAGVISVPKYFPKEKVGLANGIYGMGDIGTAVSSFLALSIAGIIGWQTTVRGYLIIIALFVLTMFIFGDAQERKIRVPSMAQMKTLSRNYKLYYLSYWYLIIFGVFVAFGISLPNYLVNHFGIDKVDVGIRSGVFIALATFLRPIGGTLGDKFNAVEVLMTDFVAMIIGATILGISDHITLFTVGCLTISICAGIGNGLAFKLVLSYFLNEVGSANSIVPMMDGSGGFFLPLVIMYIANSTGSSHLAFIFLAVLGCIALFTMRHSYQREYGSLKNG